MTIIERALGALPDTEECRRAWRTAKGDMLTNRANNRSS
jgi:hypothetical protein